MKDLRRSVIRLFLITFLLLFIAWLGMQYIVYKGDLVRMFADARRALEHSGVYLFIKERVVPFFTDRVIPWFAGVIESVKGALAPRG
ncbi:MAG: hypothetical protein IJH86_04760 [Clostridia bacterium]|nr:hypothetical protein [Clostridia bacterium]